MWSRSVGSYHLFKHSRWTSEFSWSNKQGFKRQEALKGLETNRQLLSDRNNLQQKRYNPASILDIQVSTMISEPVQWFSVL